MSADSYAKELKSSNRESKLASELIGAGLSCASAALGWMVVVGSVGAIPISGGTSAAVTYLGYSAAAASTVQCMVGIGRSGAEGFAPDKLDELDSQAWYQNTSKALDYISLVGVGASGTATIKAISNLQKSSGKSLSEVLKGLNRHERARLTKEISKQNIPNLSSKAYKQLVRSGSVKRRFSSQDISNAIQLQLKDAIGATIVSWVVQPPATSVLLQWVYTRSFPLNSREKEVFVLSAKSIATALSAIILLTMGGGLNIFFLDQLIDISNTYGPFYLWVVMMGIGALLVTIPFGMIIIHGLKFLNPINIFNAMIQIFIAICFGVSEAKLGDLFWLIALALPILALYLMNTPSYKCFITFYYELAQSRREHRRRMKNINK